MKLYEVLFDDENYYAVNKPSGVLTIPDRYNLEIPNLLTAARKKYPHLMTTHRIDKDTSGVVVFAKNEKAHAHLNKQFEAHTVEKVYTTLVLGKTPDEGQIDLRITEDPRRPGKMECHKKVGKPSLTLFKTLAYYPPFYSLVEVYPKTGRTHQIRVHFLALGYPLVVDEWYGGKEGILLSSIKKKFKLSKNEENETPIMNRLTLHASSISFLHCQTNETITVSAPLSKDFQALLTQLEKAKK